MAIALVLIPGVSGHIHVDGFPHWRYYPVPLDSDAELPVGQTAPAMSQSAQVVPCHHAMALVAFVAADGHFSCARRIRSTCPH
jgi:hypothetical protein